MVSIGPLHHGREELKPMEDYKRRYLKEFLQRTEVSLEDFIKFINDKEVKIRNCYAETIRHSSDDFVKVILVDAAFTIELILRYSFTRHRIYCKDGIYEEPWAIIDLHMTFGYLREPTSFLRDRGFVKFEQCHRVGNFINDYVVFMNYLVNIPKDVEFLAQNGIIENRPRDSEGVSTLFHNLVDGSVLYGDCFYNAELVEDLNRFCKTAWNKWKATLKQDFFNTPWATVSVVGAVFSSYSLAYKPCVLF
ncbi:hypothetical protein Dsin_019204 [Dipteronia sinensis]|uniref:Uncharacterized protein n=1 Tax=Dipteronia sinensis TaxID=43782 RepID=A0AAE0A847_9ROSI|nr:hypothetical protein Dsin_019204 [Dipteronia sinensis]